MPSVCDSVCKLQGEAVFFPLFFDFLRFFSTTIDRRYTEVQRYCRSLDSLDIFNNKAKKQKQNATVASGTTTYPTDNHK
jgi:hypothetical protein